MRGIFSRVDWLCAVRLYVFRRALTASQEILFNGKATLVDLVAALVCKFVETCVEISLNEMLRFQKEVEVENNAKFR